MTGRRSVVVCYVLCLLMALAGAVQSAWSQEVTAAIVGTVTDPSGAPIKGATVTATDTNGCKTSVIYTLVLANDCPPITVTPTSLPNATAGQAYNQTLVASGGVPPQIFLDGVDMESNVPEPSALLLLAGVGTVIAISRLGRRVFANRNAVAV